MNGRSLRFRMTVWYTGLLTASLLLFGISVYLGLGRYLDLGLRQSLAEQTTSIGEKLLVDVSAKGESYVVAETNEHYSPEINGRFLRITRQDGSLLYQSSWPKDGSFDPSLISMAVSPSLGQQGAFRRERVGPAVLIIHSFPYTTPDGKHFLIEAGAPDQEIRNVLHRLLLILAFGMPILIATAAAGGYWLMRRALRPVNEIAAQAERISSSNLNERLPLVDSGDEIQRLSVSLNRMISRLEDAFRHINRFSADVSHELRTPLTILRGELESIAQQRVSGDHLEMIGSALEETDRLSQIVDQLMAISRLDAGEACRELVRLDLGTLAASTAEQLHLLADEKAILLSVTVAPNVEVEADQTRLRQVVANLLDNAIKYTQPGGQVRLAVEVNRNRAILEVEDTGPGIAAESLPHIFERFYRTDYARSRSTGGSGLGLAIVKAICTAHGAEVEVSSTEGKGSCFRVEWPLAIKPFQLSSKVADSASVPTSGMMA